MKILKTIFKYSIYTISLFLLYVTIILIYGTATDYQPEPIIKLTVTQNSKLTQLETDTITFFNWNIGYSGLGRHADFFYDNGSFFFSNGKMVKSPKEHVLLYFEGIKKTIANNPADFVLLQEVDSAARRSYYLNQYDSLHQLFPTYSRTFAVNFNAGFVPLPLVEFWNTIGYVYAGLATYSRYQLNENTRYQYPAHFSWPTRIFNLDRCALVSQIATKQPNKYLYVINSHNSAYDSDGSLRKKELVFLKKFVEKLYSEGHYVVVGADWNQCPPNFQYDSLMPQPQKDSFFYMGNIQPDFFPADWTWAADKTVGSHRELLDTLQLGKTFVSVIDYYLISPNIELLEVKNVDTQYEFSDHQPVKLKVKLK
jgi:endonuclease/exonuclease/phosphatase family metal-dependent hydrolase